VKSRRAFGRFSPRRWRDCRRRRATPISTFESRSIEDGAARKSASGRVRRLRRHKPAAIGEAGGYFEDWIATGAHGDMDWLARTQDRRSDPRYFGRKREASSRSA